MESKRTLEVQERSLGGFDMMDASRQGSCISIFISLPLWEVLHLICVYKASSWSLGGHWRFLRGVLVVFEMVETPRIHQGKYISIFKSLPYWKVFKLLSVNAQKNVSKLSVQRTIKRIPLNLWMTNFLVTNPDQTSYSLESIHLHWKSKVWGQLAQNYEF